MINLINKESLINSDYIRSAVVSKNDDKTIINMLKKLGQVMDYMTLEMASDFYRVQHGTIERVCERNARELENYGVKVYKKVEIDKILIPQPVGLENIPNRGLRLIPIKALFVIGLLLTQSEVARKLREEVVSIAMGENRQYEKGLALVKVLESSDKIEKLDSLEKYTNILLLEEREKLDKVNRELEIKSSYLNKFLDDDECLTTTTIADDYGMSARKFNNLLSELNIQYNESKLWHLYSDYKDMGYSEVKYFRKGNKFYPIMKWTHKGAFFLYEKLRDEGIVPVCERS